MDEDKYIKRIKTELENIVIQIDKESIYNFNKKMNKIITKIEELKTINRKKQNEESHTDFKILCDLMG